MKILIADSDREFRCRFSRALSQSDPRIRIIEAASYAQTLSAVAAHPDLATIFLDVHLLQRESVEPFVALVERRKTLFVVAFLTGDQDRTVALDVHATGFISKPFVQRLTSPPC